MALSPEQLAKKKGLETWFQKVGITYDGIALYSDSGKYGDKAMYVLATEDIAKGLVLATIPKTAIISVETTGMSEFLGKNLIGGMPTRPCEPVASESALFCQSNLSGTA